MTLRRIYRNTPSRVHTLQQSAFCFLSLLQCQLLCHTDVSIKMLCLLDAVQTLPTKLCWGDSSLPESQRHLENNDEISVTLMMAMFCSSVPVSHGNETVSQHAHQTLKTAHLCFIYLFTFFHALR